MSNSASVPGTRRGSLALVLALVLGACASVPAPEPASAPPVAVQAPGDPGAMVRVPREGRVVAEDVHSFARPEIARVRHVSLDLTADFDARRLGGSATLTVQWAPGATELVLDTRDLEIQAVETAGGRALEWQLGDAVEHLGRPLTIRLPAPAAAHETDVVVRYRTSPDAAAVQWLAPEQTMGGDLPYLFTQGQAILTRTWIPTQDSPGIRQTYDARVVVPRELKAVMSAEMLTPEGEPTGAGTAYRFSMPQPIPAYLIALAIGDLAFRDVGARTGVYAEPEVVDAAAHEFADMERMLEVAERMYGPYRWGRYDVLVLPPAFPFGGMENPRLTFATPTILAGDRSLVSLIAHELAHSWSGNLVTNATWDDFWLNEGFTVYFERRILEALYGADRAAMERNLARSGLLATIEGMGARHPDTRLQYDLAGRDPDAGFTDIPYEKGATFLETIEAHAGRAEFDRFLRRYFDAHAFEPMTSTAFVEYLYANLLDRRPALVPAIRPEQWVFAMGLPDNAPPVRSDVFAEAERAASAFAAGTPAGQLDVGDWTTHEWLHFLATLPDTLPQARMADLDRAFRLSGTGNSEVLFAWLLLAIDSRYEPAFEPLERFLTEQGRRKFLAPLYRQLMQSDWGRAMARGVYREARPLYHAVSRGTVDEIVGWEEGAAR